MSQWYGVGKTLYNVTASNFLNVSFCFVWQPSRLDKALTMPRGRAWSLEVRARVIALLELGRTAAQIIQQLQLPRQTVYDYIRRYRATGRIPTVKKRDCPPRKVTLANIATVSSEIKRFPRTTARLIRAKHQSLSHLSISSINNIIRWVWEGIRGEESQFCYLLVAGCDTIFGSDRSQRCHDLVCVCVWYYAKEGFKELFSQAQVCLNHWILIFWLQDGFGMASGWLQQALF